MQEKHSDEDKEQLLWTKIGPILTSWLLRKYKPFERLLIKCGATGWGLQSTKSWTRSGIISLVKISYECHSYSIRENCHLWIFSYVSVWEDSCLWFEVFNVWSKSLKKLYSFKTDIEQLQRLFKFICQKSPLQSSDFFLWKSCHNLGSLSPLELNKCCATLLK